MLALFRILIMLVVITRPEKNGVYVGEIRDGRKHGKGKFTHKNNREMYNGDWENDQKNGDGRMTYANGEVYDGSWVDDKREGTGKMTYEVC